MTQSILVNSARETAHPSTDVLDGAINRLKSHLTGVGWTWLKNVRAKQATNVAHLKQLLQESWVELSSVYLQSLVERMQRICEAVIVAKVGHFDESKV